MYVQLGAVLAFLTYLGAISTSFVVYSGLLAHFLGVLVKSTSPSAPTNFDLLNYPAGRGVD